MARTVSKQRSRSGETKSSRGGGGSGPGATYEELYEEAERKGVKGRSSMNKAQLSRAFGH